MVAHSLHIKHGPGKTAYTDDRVLFCEKATIGDGARHSEVRVGDEVQLDAAIGYVYTVRIDEHGRQYHALVHVHKPQCEAKNRKVLLSHIKLTGARADDDLLEHLRELANGELERRRGKAQKTRAHERDYDSPVVPAGPATGELTKLVARAVTVGVETALKREREATRKREQRASKRRAEETDKPGKKARTECASSEFPALAAPGAMATALDKPSVLQTAPAATPPGAQQAATPTTTPQGAQPEAKPQLPSTTPSVQPISLPSPWFACSYPLPLAQSMQPAHSQPPSPPFQSLFQPQTWPAPLSTPWAAQHTQPAYFSPAVVSAPAWPAPSVSFAVQQQAQPPQQAVQQPSFQPGAPPTGHLEWRWVP